MLRIVFFLMLLCSPAALAEQGSSGSMSVNSASFRPGERIPEKYTCQGENINPSLDIRNVPALAKSLVLIVDDPDAPGGVWTHWVLYGIDPKARINENSVCGRQGVNDFGTSRYDGPCPPSGTHRYFYRAYALDIMLDLNEGLSRQEVEEAMRGHVLAEAELMGTVEHGS